MISLVPPGSRAAPGGVARPAVPGSPDWLRLARLARMLSWLTLGWLGIEAGAAIGAAIIARSAALLGFGLDSGIEALASVIVIWRFTGTRLTGASAERRAQQFVAVSFFLLAPYIAADALWGLIHGNHPDTSIIGLALTAGTAILEPGLGIAKRRIGARLGSAATAGEGIQNLLCAYLAAAVFAGLLANTVFGAWWLDGTVALIIAGWAVIEGRRAWAGKSCSCTMQPGPYRVERKPRRWLARWPRKLLAGRRKRQIQRIARVGGAMGGQRRCQDPLPVAGHLFQAQPVLGERPGLSVSTTVIPPTASAARVRRSST